MKKTSKLEEIGKFIHFWVWPSSFVKHWKEEGDPEDKVGETFMYAFEGLRLLTYYEVGKEIIEKYF